MRNEQQSPPRDTAVDVAARLDATQHAALNAMVDGNPRSAGEIAVHTRGVRVHHSLARIGLLQLVSQDCEPLWVITDRGRQVASARAGAR